MCRRFSVAPHEITVLSSFPTYKTVNLCLFTRKRVQTSRVRTLEKFSFFSGTEITKSPIVEMLIGSATRYIGGRRAVQTVYWRATKQNSEKLVKTGRHFNLKKPTLADSQGMKMRYSSRMTDNNVCQKV